MGQEIAPFEGKLEVDAVRLSSSAPPSSYTMVSLAQTFPILNFISFPEHDISRVGRVSEGAVREYSRMMPNSSSYKRVSLISCMSNNPTNSRERAAVVSCNERSGSSAL